MTSTHLNLQACVNPGKLSVLLLLNLNPPRREDLMGRVRNVPYAKSWGRDWIIILKKGVSLTLRPDLINLKYANVDCKRCWTEGGSLHSGSKIRVTSRPELQELRLIL